MHLAYFDESKAFPPENPLFYIGGILIPEEVAQPLEQDLTQIQFNFFQSTSLRKECEFHGKEFFHGKGSAKGRQIKERLQVFEDFVSLVETYNLPIRLVCIDVEKHRARYKYPTPEYNLGLMLICERFCDYLEQIKDIGVVFGDEEKDEVTKAVLDFSEYKVLGKTPMSGGRPVERLLDTIYFTRSHQSRFLQLADMLVYLAVRCELREMDGLEKWHERKLQEIWEKLKANASIEIQHWPSE